MAKDILIYEKNGEFLDLWIQDPTGSIAQTPGWVKLTDGTQKTSALRIQSVVDDSGLQRVRLKPVPSIMLRRENWTMWKIERVGATAPPPSQTTDDSSTYTDYGSTKSIAGMEWKTWYWIPVVILLYLGYRKLSK